MSGISAETVILTTISAVALAIPTALLSSAAFDQFRHGDGSLFLAFLILPWWTALFLAILGPLALSRLGRPIAAQRTAVFFLVVGIPLAIFGVLAFGST
jgi:hypothetical protein